MKQNIWSTTCLFLAVWNGLCVIFCDKLLTFQKLIFLIITFISIVSKKLNELFLSEKNLAHTQSCSRPAKLGSSHQLLIMINFWATLKLSKMKKVATLVLASGFIYAIKLRKNRRMINQIYNSSFRRFTWRKDGTVYNKKCEIFYSHNNFSIDEGREVTVVLIK